MPTRSAWWLLVGLVACGAPMPPGSTGGGGAAGGGAGGGAMGGGSAGGGGLGGGSGGGGAAIACPLRPACDAPLTVPAKTSFRHTASSLAALAGSPRHQGRDLFIAPGTTPWAIGKFSYGLIDKDLKDEDVDVYLLRGCGNSWEKLETQRTSEDGQHPTVAGVEDTGGRVYVDLSKHGALAVGRHRVRFVVKADNSTADAFLEVLPPGPTRWAVSDVDGTLTISEDAAFEDVLGGPPSEANEGSAAALGTLAQRGYFIVYLSARPQWLEPLTRDWLKLRGYPPGLIQTTLGFTGARGAAAATFKTDALALLKSAAGASPAIGFGNTDTDAQAYQSAGIASNRAWLYKTSPAPAFGTVHQSYVTLGTELAALPAVCP